MGRLILVAVLLAPFIEIAVFIWVGGHIGIFSTLAATIATALIGLILLRWQGLGLLMDSRAMMARGEVPAKQFAEAMMLAFAGLCLILPGFVGDAIGFILLIPPVRSLIFKHMSRSMVVVTNYEPRYQRAPETSPRAIDLDPDEYRKD